MTDQQTSRTNITEALRALPRYAPRPFSDGGGMGPSPSGGWLSAFDVFQALDAAEPRSDAVTAPDEPSTTEALKRDHPERLALADALGDMLQYEYPDKYAMGFALLSRLAAQGVVVREARAASASVPPLDEAKLTRLLPSVMNFRIPLAQPARHPVWREIAAELAAAYAAETPEQGRGDE